MEEKYEVFLTAPFGVEMDFSDEIEAIKKSKKLTHEEILALIRSIENKSKYHFVDKYITSDNKAILVFN